MSSMRFGRRQKLAALVPVLAVSAIWTASSLGLGGATSPAVGEGGQAPAPITLPDGTPLPPASTLTGPASVGTPSTSIARQTASAIIESADTSGIPAAALAAYQRAATVVDQADTSCNLGWQLIAAIGRIESDHGRSDGNRLTSTGISTPGIFGPRLDGTHGTSVIHDTDGGTVDGDTTYDRAVGPMQFLPSTWSQVAVDGDNDGKRNPQDINDAALAAAVYLCAGGQDLSSTAGQKAAVYRYNHSDSYVNTVLAVADAYLAGDYTSVPDSALAAYDPFTPLPAAHHAKKKTKPSAAVTVAPTPVTAKPAAKHPASSKPTKSTTPAKPTATKAPTPAKAVQETVATLTQLTQVCTDALTKTYKQAPDKAIEACVKQLTGKTLPDAQKDVTDVVASLAGLLQGLLGGLGSLLGSKG